MKNKNFYAIFLCICLVVFFFELGVATGQSTNESTYSVETLLSGDVQAVSGRISTLYGADVHIVEQYVQAAINLEQRIGISAPVIIAIAIHESSFKSELFVNAGNPFGIKASKPWLGPTYSKWHDGEETRFRMYGSTEEAIEDFGNFVKSRLWYADVFKCPVDDARCVIDGLKRTDLEPGYSMNPNWDEAILGIIQKVGLQSLATR